MRFLKVLILVLLFFFSMMFFVQNTEVLSQTMALRFNLFVRSWETMPLPFYFLLLLGVLGGGLFTLTYFFAEKMRLTKQLREYKEKSARLEQEVNSLRNLPLEEQSYPSASGEGMSGEN